MKGFGRKDEYTIRLSWDEALVLFELVRSQELQTSVDIPERNALWAVECALEEVLVEPFSEKYIKLLAVARDSLVKKYGK